MTPDRMSGGEKVLQSQIVENHEKLLKVRSLQTGTLSHLFIAAMLNQAGSYQPEPSTPTSPLQCTKSPAEAGLFATLLQGS